MYEPLLLVHILAGMAWLGGGVMINVTSRRLRRSADWEAADRTLLELAWADTWLAVPAPVLVVATGILMIVDNGGLDFSQAWVYASLGLVVLYEVVAALVGGPAFKTLEASRAEGSVGSTGYRQAFDRLVGLGTALLALLVVIVALMVFKPGL